MVVQWAFAHHSNSTHTGAVTRPYWQRHQITHRPLEQRQREQHPQSANHHIFRLSPAGTKPGVDSAWRTHLRTVSGPAPNRVGTRRIVNDQANSAFLAIFWILSWHSSIVSPRVGRQSRGCHFAFGAGRNASPQSPISYSVGQWWHLVRKNIIHLETQQQRGFRC